VALVLDAVSFYLLHTPRTVSVPFLLSRFFYLGAVKMAGSDAKGNTNLGLRAADDELYGRGMDSDDDTTAWATANDMKDMDALGLTPTFKRRFKFVAMVAFSSTVVVAWQNTMATFYFALYNGGTGGLFWGFIFSLSAMTFVYLTIAELSSCFPTAGGQYQWVSECAPASMRRVLAYCTGWLVTLSWITFLSACAAIIGNITKFCILIYHPNSAAANSQWLPNLISLAMLVGGALFNIHLAKKFPTIEAIMLWYVASTPPNLVHE
jgi:hypothetical protein